MEDNRMEIMVSMNYKNSNDILADMRQIIDTSQRLAYQAVDTTLVKRNWLIGCRISEEELKGETRTASYGKEIIKKLSKDLTELYGRGYDASNLYKYKQFYEMYPDILDTLCLNSSEGRLSWSHYRTLLQVKDSAARAWYEKEAFEQTWSIRSLQRNISSQYYYRMLRTQNPKAVEDEMRKLTGKHSFQPTKIYHGAWKRICVCCKTAAYSDRKRRLLY